MAQMKPIHTWAFLIALLVCHEILFVEGRQLKSMKKQEGQPTENGSNSQQTPSRSKQNDDVHVASSINDHNLSVEHPVVRKGKTSSPTPYTQTLVYLSAVSESINDFRPTKPGNSPGIGHSYTQHNVDIQPKQDSKGPAHSPGIGHSSQNKDTTPNP